MEDCLFELLVPGIEWQMRETIEADGKDERRFNVYCRISGKRSIDILHGSCQFRPVPGGGD